jgi:chromosome segregation ATPase
MAALGTEIADHAAVLAPAQRQLDQAEAHLSGFDARSAIASAQAASEIATELLALLASFATLRAGIVQGRQEAETLAAEGFRMDASHAALDAARAALSTAADALQSEDRAGAETNLQEAHRLLDQAIAAGRDWAALHTDNVRLIDELAARGQTTAALIAEGRRIFDIVDEFAESTWSDIRGNGSEAEAAADRAEEHWERARELNTMEVQEFGEAREALDAAVQELGYVEALIDAIKQRLHDLEQARDTARAIVAEAERSIAAGWEFVRSNDPDVGKVPEDQLQQAAEQLAQAQAEMQQERPDWLVLVQAAQQADQFADAALAGARSEVEVMDRLREQVRTAQQLATAEIKKIANFSGLHGDDINAENNRAIETVRAMCSRPTRCSSAARRSKKGSGARPWNRCWLRISRSSKRRQKFIRQCMRLPAA